MAPSQFEYTRMRHRFKRPVQMPTVTCLCGERVTAPPDMGIMRQRDYCLDWFNTHLKAERARRRLAKKAE